MICVLSSIKSECDFSLEIVGKYRGNVGDEEHDRLIIPILLTPGTESFPDGGSEEPRKKTSCAGTPTPSVRSGACQHDAAPTRPIVALYIGQPCRQEVRTGCLSTVQRLTHSHGRSPWRRWYANCTYRKYIENLCVWESYRVGIVAMMYEHCSAVAYIQPLYTPHTPRPRRWRVPR